MSVETAYQFLEDELISIFSEGEGEDKPLIGKLGYTNSDTGVYSIQDETDPRYFFVRFANASYMRAEHRGVVAPIPDLSVEVKRERGQDGRYHHVITGVAPDQLGGTQGGNVTVGVHFHDRMSAMAYPVDHRLLLNIPAFSVGGLVVLLDFGFYVDDDGRPQYFAPQSLNMTAYVPSFGNRLWAIIAILRPSGTLVVLTPSPTASGTALPVSDIDTSLIDPDLHAPLVAVQLYGGQQFIAETDYHDMRLPVGVGGGNGGTGAFYFTELLDVPASYTGAAGQGVRVNGTATGLEFYSITSGFYQTVRDNGSAETQRAALNFINGSGVDLTATDDSGGGETEIRAILNINSLVGSGFSINTANDYIALYNATVAGNRKVNFADMFSSVKSLTTMAAAIDPANDSFLMVDASSGSGDSRRLTHTQLLNVSNLTYEPVIVPALDRVGFWDQSAAAMRFTSVFDFLKYGRIDLSVINNGMSSDSTSGQYNLGNLGQITYEAEQGIHITRSSPGAGQQQLNFALELKDFALDIPVSGDLLFFWDVSTSLYKAVDVDDLPGGSGGVVNFTDLGDVPASYTGHSLKGVRVNTGETALEFYTTTGGGDFMADGSVPMTGDLDLDDNNINNALSILFPYHPSVPSTPSMSDVVLYAKFGSDLRYVNSSGHEHQILAGDLATGYMDIPFHVFMGNNSINGVYLITFNEIPTPVSPAAPDTGFIFVDDTDNRLYYADDAGAIFDLLAAGVDEIAELADVDYTTPPTTGDVLVFDGTNWVPSAPPSGTLIYTKWDPDAPPTDSVTGTDEFLGSSLAGDWVLYDEASIATYRVHDSNLIIESALNDNGSLLGIKRAIPETPEWTIEAHVNYTGETWQWFRGASLALFKYLNTESEMLMITFAGDGDSHIRVEYYWGFNTWGFDVGVHQYRFEYDMYLRITYDGTSFRFSYSKDGIEVLELVTVAAAELAWLYTSLPEAFGFVFSSANNLTWKAKMNSDFIRVYDYVKTPEQPIGGREIGVYA